MKSAPLLFKNLIFVAVLLLAACEKKEEPAPEPIKPWQEHEIMPGNFSINSKAIVTHQSSSEKDVNEQGADLYQDYLNREDLPSSPFEFYTIRAYIPTVSNAYTINVNGHGGTLYYYGGNNKRIVADNSSGFVETTTMGGIEYSVFEIVIRDYQFTMNQANFEKIVFVLNVSYTEDATGLVKDESLVNIVIFADTASSPGDSGGNDNTGDTGVATFWVNQDYGCGASIHVSIPNYGTQSITAFYSGNPGCGSDGSANFYNLPMGTYSYTATSSEGCSWDNYFTISSDCSTIQLTL